MENIFLTIIQLTSTRNSDKKARRWYSLLGKNAKETNTKKHCRKLHIVKISCPDPFTAPIPIDREENDDNDEMCGCADDQGVTMQKTRRGERDRITGVSFALLIV